MGASARVMLWSLAATVVGGTVASHVRTPALWARVFDYPRPQLAALAVLAAAGLRRVEPRRAARRAGVAALLGTVAWQCWQISAYTPLRARQTRARRRRRDDPAAISLLIANVYMDNRDVGRLEAAVAAHEPDLVVLLEPDGWWIEALSRLASRFPHRVLHPLPNTYGIALYSRLELVEPTVEFLVDPEVPSVHTGVRLRSGAVVHLHAIHPRPPRPGSGAEERDAELVLVGRRVARERGPVIVAGDLNDVAWSHTTRLFQRISSLLDPRRGRGFYNTFPVYAPLWRFPIDQVFHTPDLALGALEVLPDIGSDHFPVHVRLHFDPQARREQAPPRPSSGDSREAAQIVGSQARGGTRTA
jgi:endonuclease/exonuclease/phosphatase (EEP) superfamily protein YafD